MFNSKKRKEERLKSKIPDSLTPSTYNMIIGGCLAYGFIMNAIMVFVAGNFFRNINPIVFLIGYIVCMLGGAIMASLSRNPIVSFIGYNLIVVPIGAVLSICLPDYNPQNIIAAVIVTALITGIMMILSVMFKRFFSRLGIVLCVSLIVGIILEFIAMLFGYGGDLFNWLFILIFSLYIGYDWYKAQSYPKTLDNAIDSALDLYLDIINIFLRLLEIFGKKD